MPLASTLRSAFVAEARPISSLRYVNFMPWLFSSSAASLAFAPQTLTGTRLPFTGTEAMTAPSTKSPRLSANTAAISRFVWGEVVFMSR